MSAAANKDRAKKARKLSKLESAMDEVFSQRNANTPDDPIAKNFVMSEPERELRRMSAKMEGWDFTTENGFNSGKNYCIDSLRDRYGNNTIGLAQLRNRSQIYELAPIIVNENISSLNTGVQSELRRLHKSNLFNIRDAKKGCASENDKILNGLSALMERKRLNDIKTAYVEEVERRKLYNIHGKLVKDCIDIITVDNSSYSSDVEPEVYLNNIGDNMSAMKL